jgi:flagellar export protein FliJ
MLIKRLKRLIEIKEKKKEEKERLLKEVMESIKRTEKEIKKAREDYENAHKSLSRGIIEGGDFSQLKDYLFYLEEKEIELEKEKLGLSKRANELKKEILLIYREIRKLEILRDKALSAERKEELKKLQKRLDESALRSKENLL